MNTRKELPKTALPRIYFIDRQIASGSYPNTRTLAEAYETSEPTISRDIEFMRTTLNAPIVFDHNRKGYYYPEKTYRLSAGYATAAEMLSLSMAKNLLSLYRNTPLYETARQLLELISLPLAPPLFAKSDADQPPWYENRIVVPPVASAPVDPETWDNIMKGLRDNQVITFDYLGTWDDAPRCRRARPYQLLFDTGVWYLYAYDEDRAAIRVFSLPRIQKLTLTNETFILPDDYDYCSREDASYFGVFAGAQQRHFRVVFYDAAMVWVRERQWAADQIIEASAACVILDFTSTQYEKVLEWVLARGSCAVPLEPPELVADWREEVRAMMTNAGGE
ncbi:MAG: WYL domain-containing protein [Spirochaetales bacterium]|jgi:predicted DNA-binding transcriptional regulator YafY|nr:WYL domain-containing protein [Spirochaetales bacterium]